MVSVCSSSDQLPDSMPPVHPPYRPETCKVTTIFGQPTPVESAAKQLQKMSGGSSGGHECAAAAAAGGGGEFALGHLGHHVRAGCAGHNPILVQLALGRIRRALLWAGAFEALVPAAVVEDEGRPRSLSSHGGYIKQPVGLLADVEGQPLSRSTVHTHRALARRHPAVGPANLMAVLQRSWGGGPEAAGN